MQQNIDKKVIELQHDNKKFHVKYHYFDGELRIDNIIRIYTFKFFLFDLFLEFTFSRKVHRKTIPMPIFSALLKKISLIDNK